MLNLLYTDSEDDMRYTILVLCQLIGALCRLDQPVTGCLLRSNSDSSLQSHLPHHHRPPRHLIFGYLLWSYIITSLSLPLHSLPCSTHPKRSYQRFFLPSLLRLPLFFGVTSQSLLPFSNVFQRSVEQRGFPVERRGFPCRGPGFG